MVYFVPSCLCGKSASRHFAPIRGQPPRPPFVFLNQRSKSTTDFSADFADGRGFSSIQSALIRACQPEPWRRLVISGKVISSITFVTSCKIRCWFGSTVHSLTLAATAIRANGALRITRPTWSTRPFDKLRAPSLSRGSHSWLRHRQRSQPKTRNPELPAAYAASPAASASALLARFRM